jgi:MYXO-CTERM domain-containing protein
MMKAKSLFLAVISVLVVNISLAPSLHATLFQLAGSAAVEAVDEAPSFSLTVDGITATLTANIGVLNTTAVSGFGVNAPGTGDETSQVDNTLGLESVSIVFNLPVRLDQIVLSLFTGGATGDLASLTVDGFGAATLNPLAPALDVYDFVTNNTVPVGQSIVLAYQAGNGFSFDSFSVSEVPAPASLALALIGLAGLGWSRRKK